jgi:hypothetical protein
MRPLRRPGRYGALLAGSTLALSAALSGVPATILAQTRTTTESYTLSAIACSSSTSCKAGGYHGTTVFNQTPLAEGWNGSKWSTEKTSQDDGDPSNWIYGITCVSSIFCWAVGASVTAIGETLSPIAELWQGKRWSEAFVPTPNQASLVSVSCFSVSLCWAVGGIKSSAGAGAPLGDEWSQTDEGSKWAADSNMPEPKGATSATLSSVSCTTDTNCFAVGRYTSSAGVVGTLAERLTENRWKVQFMPNPAGVEATYLDGVSCTSDTDCVAVGYAEETSLEYEGVAEHWNGSLWKVMSTVKVGSGGAVLNGVSCFSTICMAVGYEFGSTSITAFSERWSGSSWKLAKAVNQTGETSSYLNSVVCTSTTSCNAVGYGENTASMLTVTLGEIWNGTTWKLVRTVN